MTDNNQPKKKEWHCKALILTCRKCGKEFENFMTGPRECPECGESRACNIEPLPGYEYCFRHGGPKLPWNYRMTGSSKSRWPLLKLASKYAEQLSNPDVTTLKGARTVLSARVYDLLDRIESVRDEDRVGTLQKLWSDFQTARYNHNEDEMKRIATAIDNSFEEAWHDYRSWDQIIKILGEDRKMAETQVRIMKDLSLLYTAEQVYEAIAQLLGVIIKVENDPIKLEVIAREFTQFIGDADIIDLESSEPEAPQYRPSPMDLR